MGRFWWIGLLFLFGCGSSVSESELTLLNGYWEIEKVVFSDGSTKEYRSSLTLDYIELDDKKGFRKKVYPKLDGSFETTDDAEFFTIEPTSKGYILNYDTGLSEWQETLVAISENGFSVANEANLIYTYKRYEALNITE
ncbi:hypothetical protein [Allomuricauda sp. SCSIO 65647]|uniref:hypothetical protein n=1 Tax=Allomuricauda sp. SCSIO 65647 TaxID=2908843 RepID=UPI001F3A408C|nr:hypothetical protein [Muricauda sp. SCSIO 65647]UJH67899.1 hypothetical protein L0P89_01445 [Muricauda sp. SCSIO 65647]